MTEKKRKQKQQKESQEPKQFHEMSEEERAFHFHIYTLEKLNFEIAQMREAFRLSIKNQKQAESWIV